jgi:hypothetical protein
MMRMMHELDGQVVLVVLILGEDARELADWEIVALHEERPPGNARWEGHGYEEWMN